jgi:glycerophosphoryl diester phosphodiesterase
MNIEMLEKIAKKIPVASKSGIRPSVPELIPFLIEFLKEYEQSKWVKFDCKDPSTWPEHGDSVLVLLDKRFLKEIGEDGKAYFADFSMSLRSCYCDFEVYHWQPLPEILKG